MTKIITITLKISIVGNKEPGNHTVSLYAVNCDVLQWLSWRKMKNIVLKNFYKTGSLFVQCTDDEFEDFIAFRDAKRLLSANDKYEVPYSKAFLRVLVYQLTFKQCTMRSILCLSLEDTLATAQWIDAKLNN